MRHGQKGYRHIRIRIRGGGIVSTIVKSGRDGVTHFANRTVHGVKRLIPILHRAGESFILPILNEIGDKYRHQGQALAEHYKNAGSRIVDNYLRKGANVIDSVVQRGVSNIQNRVDPYVKQHGGKVVASRNEILRSINMAFGRKPGVLRRIK